MLSILPWLTSTYRAIRTSVRASITRRNEKRWRKQLSGLPTPKADDRDTISYFKRRSSR